MNKTVIILFAIFNVCAYSNPLAIKGGGFEDYEMFKTWERCLVAVGETKSQVSCAVGYNIKNPPSSGSGSAGYIGFKLPVYYVGEPSKKSPTLEIDGHVYLPKRPPVLLKTAAEKKQLGIDGEWHVAMYEFKVSIGKNKETIAIVASYEQPSIKGAFRYIPLFESGTRKRPKKDFSLTAFPSEPGGRLVLLSKHPEARALMNTRITLDLEHQHEVVIRAKEANNTP